MQTLSRSATFAPRVQARVARRSVSVRAGPINPDIKKDDPKVVDFLVDGQIVGDKPAVSYCRCWRSATFPLCNGAHVQHNKDTGDNVGPLVVKKE